ncbi:Sec23/Sec24, trunk domain [Fusarium oxysporum f. sp. vasinfectum]|nr:Sec23/Sec24, trunk domain [Fusarium oxysporum f. sp. vasinfectum]
MADYAQYHALGQGEVIDPNDPNRTSQPSAQQFQPPIAPSPYQQQASPYGAPQYLGGQQAPPPMTGSPAPAPGYGYAPPQAQAPPGQAPPSQDATLAAQLGGMNLGDGHGTARRKKKDRHAYHTVEPTGSSQAFNGMPPQGTSATQFLDSVPGGPGFGGQFGSPQGTPQMQSQSQFSAPVNPAFGPGPVAGTPGVGEGLGTASVSTSGPKGVSPDDMPSVPASRDAIQQYYLKNVYPTFERHVPPPSTVSFVAYDQGNSSPKYTRLTLNNIPHYSGRSAGYRPFSGTLAAATSSSSGWRSRNSCPRLWWKQVCLQPLRIPQRNSPQYFSATNPQGVRVDRDTRPELHRGTVEFVVPKEYWTREPVGLRWLFLIDVTQESYNKGYVEAFCEGIRVALYGGEDQELDENGEPKRRIPEGAKVGFVTYDKDIHFYNVNPALDQAQMMIMPDLEDPFVPLSEGLFVDPYESKDVITSLLTRLPDMFSTIKNPEPALLAALNSALAALEATGGKVVASCSALPTWGPGRLFMRDNGNHPGGEIDKKLYTTEHPAWKKVAEKMAASGVGADFFLAAPSGGYLDIATIGHVSSTTGGETFYYPNFIAARDSRKLSLEISHAVTRETGFQALMKVRCSNGLQVSGYHGNFIQHTFGADLEIGVIDADKAMGVSFSYDGKLDPKLDAHFQSALLYTTASGERRVRCSNVIASVTETSKESGAREQGIRECLKFVDQDAVIGMLAKEASTKLATTSSNLKDIRHWLSEKAIDVLACYRKHAAQQHPPGQLVMPERLKEYCMYLLGLLKCRALKGGVENSDRRVHEMRMLRSMGALELSLYLYPRMIPIHNLAPEEGFADPRQAISRCHLRSAHHSHELSLVCLLWFHSQTSPNLISDLFGEDKDSLKTLDPYTSALPLLETHLNAQVRNIIEFLRTMRGSKGLTIQLARQGIDGAEFDFARMLVEDRNNEAQSYVDWLVHIHKGVQLELSGQRKKEGEEHTAASLSNFAGLRPAYW